MKKNVERSDPVLPEGYREVTPDQLDSSHTTCGDYRCQGPAQARLRRLTTSLGSIADSFDRVRGVATQVTEPLAAWEVELLEGVAREESMPLENRAAAHSELREFAARESRTRIVRTGLAAGLQHQRINPTFQ